MKSHVMESNHSCSQHLHLQQLETLGLIAGGIAHDFNNLLTNIIGQASIALATLPADNHARRHIEKAIQSAEFATALTQQLLEFANSKPSSAELININRLIQDNINLIGLSLFDNIILTLDLHENLPPIYLKQTLIRQMIMNLLLNAIEAIQCSSGLITIRTGKQVWASTNNAPPFINGHHLLPGIYVFVQIQDNGIGMDDSVLSNIFKPFYTTKPQGHGLGLATMLTIVEEHDGAVAVKSQPGKGTTFTIFLPVHTKRIKLQ